LTTERCFRLARPSSFRTMIRRPSN